jgi:hypothetical protein
MREMPFQRHKNFKNREGNRMPPGPDPQRNARLQAIINFPISGKRGIFLLLANTLQTALSIF